MSVEEIEANVRRFFTEVWNQGNLAVIDELFVPDYVTHMDRLGVAPGAAGFKQFIAMNRAAFPDIHFTIDDLLVHGNKCMTRWTARGTHLGDYVIPVAGRVAPTGRLVTWEGATLHYIAGGKFVEGWVFADYISLLDQLGLMPA